MNFQDLIAGTLRTLWAHKLRTALTMFGIAWGIVSITLMTGAGEGLRKGQEIQAGNFGKDILIVFAGRTSMQAGGTRAGRLIRWRDTDWIQATADSPACSYVLPELGKGGTQVRSRYNAGSLLVTGSLPPFAAIRSLAVAEGRFYNWEDHAAGRRVAFLGSDAAKQLFATRSPIGETIHIDQVPYTIIGVMRQKEQDSSYDGRDINKVFIPFNSILRDFPERPPLPRSSIDQFIVTARSAAHHDDCKTQLRRSLARLHDFDPRDEEAAFIWDTFEQSRAFRQMSDGMKYFLGAVGIVTLLLGGLGVMNVMLVAVRERTREIGVRKAVGATRGAILGQFFTETIIVVFLSGGAGLAVSYALCAAVNSIKMPAYFAGLLFTWEMALTAALLLGAVAVLAAIYPAGRAAAVDPIEALRYEAGG